MLSPLLFNDCPTLGTWGMVPLSFSILLNEQGKSCNAIEKPSDTEGKPSPALEPHVTNEQEAAQPHHRTKSGNKEEAVRREGWL